MPSQDYKRKGNLNNQRKGTKKGAKRRRKRRIRNLICLFFIFVFLIILCIFGIIFVKYSNSLNPVGDGSNKVVITIEDGETFDQVMNDLKEHNLIKSSFYANVYARLNHKNTYYAGMYELDDSMGVPEILDHIEEQENIQNDNIMVTIPEGKWAEEIAQIIQQEFGHNAADVINQWNDPEYIKELCEDYEFLDIRDLNRSAYKVKLEGYLFPNTYEFKKDASIDEITRTFLNHFASFYDIHRNEFSKSKYTIHELVTLASVVQFESSSPESMKTIAGVFYNRLNKGMMLQSSVTVCYALYDKFQDPMDCETKTDINSPYNTYIHKGFPIGPILNAGEDAFIAVLEPKNSDYYYFAADIYGKIDGKIHFSKTLEEHEKICRKMGLIPEEEVIE